MDDLDLDDVMPFSLLFVPSDTSGHSMPVVKGQTGASPGFAAMPIASLMLTGEWTGAARLRIFLIPETGSPEQPLLDFRGEIPPVVITPIRAAATGEGAVLRAYVSHHQPSFDLSTTRLILNVIPMPYS